jgi:gliding motility-associated-like protein
MRLIVLITFYCLLTHPTMSQQWVQTKGPEGGRIRSLCAVGDTYFAATDGAGVFISSNNGDVWSASGLNRGEVNVVTVAHNTIVYAGVYDGIYRSADLGISWTSVGFGRGASALLTKGDTVFAADTEHGNGFFFSIDNANSWKKPVNNGLPKSTVFNLVKIGRKIFAGTAEGVFASSDLGDNWTSVNNGIDPINRAIYTIYVSGTTLFAGTSNSNSFYRSTDNGAHWNAIGNFQNTTSAITGDGLNLYVGSSCAGFFRSSDNGNTWTRFNTGLHNTCITSLLVKGSQILAGSGWGGGIYVSNDAGNSWSKKNSGLKNAWVSTLMASDTVIYAGTYWNDLYKSSDKGHTWSPLKVYNIGGPWSNVNTAITSIVFSNNSIFASGIFSMIRSKDGGQTWKVLSIPTTTQFVHTIAAQSDTLWATVANGDFVRSTDNGDLWNKVGSIPTQQLNCLLLNGSSFFVGSQNGIFVSRDKGASWSLINTGRFTTSLTKMGQTLIAGTNKGIYISNDNGISWLAAGLSDIYVNCVYAYDGQIYAGDGVHGVFRSNDKGSTWVPIGQDIGQVNSIVAIKDKLFAGTFFSGVWISSICDPPPAPTVVTTYDTNGAITFHSSSPQGNQWFLDDVPIAGATDSFYTPSLSGIFSVQVTVANCQSTFTITPSCTPPEPTISVAYGLNGEVTFHSSSAQFNQWFLNGTLITGATQPTYTTTIPGKYTVKVSKPGCKSISSAAASCSAPPKPVITTESFQGTQVTLRSSVNRGNQWFLNGVAIAGAGDSIYVATASGNYSVISSLGWCKSEMSSTVTFEINYPDPRIVLPNVFTPNGDNKNPVFKPIVYDNVQVGDLIIINRWGQQIFQTSDPGSGWDGGISDTGVYYYLLHFLDLNGNEGTVKGWVQIIR